MLRTVDPLNDPAWRDLMRTARGSVFGSPRWLGAISDTYGFEISANLVVDADDRARAGLAFAQIDDFLGSRQLSVPFCDYIDPVADHDDDWHHHAHHHHHEFTATRGPALCDVAAGFWTGAARPGHRRQGFTPEEMVRRIAGGSGAGDGRCARRVQFQQPDFNHQRHTRGHLHVNRDRNLGNRSACQFLHAGCAVEPAVGIRARPLGVPPIRPAGVEFLPPFV